MAANIPAKGSNLSRFELINFVNRTLAGHLDFNLLHVEKLSTGAAYCQMMAKLFPNSVAIQRVKNKSKLQREWISNFKILEASFKKMSVVKEIPIHKLVKGRLQDNLEFLQWFKRFYDANSKGAPKDPATAGSSTYRRSADPPKGPGNYKGNTNNAPTAPKGAPKESAPAGSSTYRRSADPPKGPGNYKGNTNNAPTDPKGAPKQSDPVGASRPRRATDPPKRLGNYKGKASNAPTAPKGAPKDSAPAGSSTYRRSAEPPKRPGNYKGNSNAPPAGEGAAKGSAPIGASRLRRATEPSKRPWNYKGNTNNAPAAPKGAPKQSDPPKRPTTYKSSKSNAPTAPKGAPKESAPGGSRTYRRDAGPPKPVPKPDGLQKKSENTGIVPPNKRSNVLRRATPKPTEKAGGDTLPSIPPGTVEALIDERDFFYSKLRDIEIICHHSADNGRVPEDIYKPVQDVLYHCREGFAPPKPSTSKEANNCIIIFVFIYLLIKK